MISITEKSLYNISATVTPRHHLRIGQRSESDILFSIFRECIINIIWSRRMDVGISWFSSDHAYSAITLWFKNDQLQWM